MSEIYLTISMISFSLSVAFLLISVFFWFKLDILKIIGDLSGRNAKKAIEKIRKENKEYGKKQHRPSRIHLVQGKLLEPVKASRRLGMKESEVTMILSNGEMKSEEVTLLINNDMEEAANKEDFNLIENIIIIHTEEVI